MSMEYDEFLVRASIQADVLEAWVAAGWLTPNAEEGMQQFSEIDVARARLIQDLRRDIGVNDEGVGVILDLIDQLHGLRRTLGHLVSALQAQPQDLRERLALANVANATDAQVAGMQRALANEFSGPKVATSKDDAA
jgi:chaperone modulatory protein CbpM